MISPSGVHTTPRRYLYRACERAPAWPYPPLPERLLCWRLARCEAEELTPYISDNRERHNLPWDERFKSPPPRPEDADAVTTMRHRLRTPEGKVLYAKRKSTVETVF